jgi:hypothetical protein
MSRIKYTIGETVGETGIFLIIFAFYLVALRRSNRQDN